MAQYCPSLSVGGEENTELSRQTLRGKSNGHLGGHHPWAVESAPRQEVFLATLKDGDTFIIAYDAPNEPVRYVPAEQHRERRSDQQVLKQGCLRRMDLRA